MHVVYSKYVFQIDAILTTTLKFQSTQSLHDHNNLK